MDVTWQNLSNLTCNTGAPVKSPDKGKKLSVGLLGPPCTLGKVEGLGIDTCLVNLDGPSTQKPSLALIWILKRPGLRDPEYTLAQGIHPSTSCISLGNQI